MKKHISQKAIDAVAKEFKSAFVSFRNAPNAELREYFCGKRYAIVDTFATLTGQTWEDAFDRLSKRSENL